jgi:hypothetical protein
MSSPPEGPRDGRWLTAARLAPVVLAVLSLTWVPGLSACASSPPVGTARPLPLDQRVDRLVVRRTDAFPENHTRFSFPAVVTVSDAKAARAVVRVLLALPKPSPGVYFGPADLGITYHLAFYAGGERVLAVSVDATGLRRVTGLGPERVAAASLWRTLGVAMGLSRPTQATFAGTMQGQPGE